MNGVARHATQPNKNPYLTLLREHALCNSEQAFAALVSSHVDLVYSVALWQVGDPHLAEEIVQDIFLPMRLWISAHRLGFREGGALRRPDI